MPANTDKYDSLRLENQLCFPLYAASKEIIKRYKPYLDKINLTYTQYITMMVMWEHKQLNVKELGKNLFLDSGTLTPVLKKLEEKEFVSRQRSKEDEREVIVSITERGKELEDEALAVPAGIMTCIKMDREDSMQLYQLLYKLLNSLS